jgi:hypothetical protein
MGAAWARWRMGLDAKRIKNGLMKIWKALIILGALMVFHSCETNNTEQDEIDTTEEISFQDSQLFGANHWDEFRFGIVNNDPDFDILKYYDPEQVSQDVVSTLLDDDFTKMMLESTTYDLLEDAIFDGISTKAFYVIIATQDISIGTIYYFRETSYGLQLLGTMPY